MRICLNRAFAFLHHFDAIRGVLRVGRLLAGASWGILARFFRAWSLGTCEPGETKELSPPITDIQVRSAWALVRLSGRGCSHCRKKLPLVWESHWGTDHHFAWSCVVCRAVYVRMMWDDFVVDGGSEPGGIQARIQCEHGVVLFADDGVVCSFEQYLRELENAEWI